MSTTTKAFTKATARRWMRESASGYRDDCGEVNSTALAEACAQAFDVNDVGGPLDDPDHWIWELAIATEQATP